MNMAFAIMDGTPLKVIKNFREWDLRTIVSSTNKTVVSLTGSRSLFLCVRKTFANIFILNHIMYEEWIHNRD